jgi:hypothetical protein
LPCPVWARGYGPLPISADDYQLRSFGNGSLQGNFGLFVARALGNDVIRAAVRRFDCSGYLHQTSVLTCSPVNSGPGPLDVPGWVLCCAAHAVRRSKTPAIDSAPVFCFVLAALLGCPLLGDSGRGR